MNRMVCASGEREEEKCELKINVTPGMRAGTQFVFACEGDELDGMVPSDVRVTLVLEPHPRSVSPPRQEGFNRVQERFSCASATTQRMSVE